MKHTISVRSDFSIGESTFQVARIVERAAALGYESVAIVDTMTISALVPFFQAAQKKGLKPVIGCTLRVYDDPKHRKPTKDDTHEDKDNPFFQIKVFVRNENGLRSLFALLTKGYSKENFYYHARVGLEDVLALEDVVVTTGDLFSVFHHRDYARIIDRLRREFPTFVEIVPIDTPLFDTLNEMALTVASALGVSTIASYPAFYEDPAHADSLDVLRAIAGNQKVTARSLPRPHIRDWALHEPKSLAHRIVKLSKRMDPRFAPLLAYAARNTGVVAGLCDYSFTKLAPCLPKMAENEFEALLQQVKQGWSDRLGREVMGYKPDAEQLVAYKERLAYELAVLKKMGFAGYFLLVQEIVTWSKFQGILVGPGRGSVGGSLVAYLLHITDVDPMRFGLLFERFINPERIDLPDADLDFMSSRRHEVIQYITERWGAECVAGIANYATLGAASALRDVSRVHELHPIDYDCSKQMLKEHGVPLSLEESAEQVPDIDKFRQRFPDIWKHATTLEGCMRGRAQHAAGVVVAGEPVVRRAFIDAHKETAGAAPGVVNWDKDAVESWGLIKMDILGLSTLDVLNVAAQYIRERHGKRIDFTKLPLNEPDVMDAFGRGQTVGVFQFEGSGMRKLLKDLALGGRLTFDDLSAATALFRPGPLDAGLVDEYIQVKQGAKHPYYEHPSMEVSLKETYGVMAYQEQVMQVARDIAGFTLAEADHLRKAIGKKDKDKMAQMREKFVTGAVEHGGMIERRAEALWEKIEGYAAYSFNKSHSVEYSVISYWTMWVKVRYPAEFFAAALTVVDDEEKLAPLVIDAKSQGIEVLPPDINVSSNRIEIKGERSLTAPFQAVKGISTNVATKLVELREKVAAKRPKTRHPFESFAEFEADVKNQGFGRNINSMHRERLRLVGAFASLGDGLPALHPDRLKDRLEFMPGFTVDAVKASRSISADRLTQLELERVIADVNACTGCSLAGGTHPVPTMGKTPKFMMVFDNPSNPEERACKMFQGDSANYIRAALKAQGISANDGYYTALVKSPKQGKLLTNEQINGCSQFLKREIELLKPPVIVAMGSNAIRYFAPDIKGNPADLLGKVIFSAALDASIVFGFNPAQIHFDKSKLAWVDTIAEKLSDLLT